MPLSDVDRIYDEFTALLKVLADQNEISLQAAADDSFRKVLVLSAASYFEHELTAIVAAYVDEISASDALIKGLVQSKAIDRQYHTWFNWKEKNANQFFGMFGNEFKTHMAAVIKASPDLDRSIKAFLEMGQQRNRLAHQNFAGFTMEKTAEEIFQLYKDSQLFIETVNNELRVCSGNLRKAAEHARRESENNAEPS
jgi:hypothetical protein